MRLKKSFRLALNILLHSKLRSWLTIVGIVIGVAAVVAIVSIGEGLQQNVQSRLSGLGADLITVSPGGGRAAGGFRGFGGGGGVEGAGQQNSAPKSAAKNLTKRDAQLIQSIDGVKFVHGSVSGRGEGYYLGETTSVSVSGIDPSIWKEITSSELESGRFLGSSDYGMVVVGNRIAQKTFKQALAINRMITIDGKPFKIVGILKESGAQGGDDNRILIPINAARDTILSIGDEKLDSIVVKTENTDVVDAVTAEIDSKLMLARHLTEKSKDYSVQSSKQTQERLTGITQTMTLFLGAIAAVSLIVGAVGIANTMFTSVLEKTKEIGIMKAIGAKNKDILLIFLFNAGLVGLVGGLLGILLGSAVSFLIPSFGLNMIGPGGGQMTTVISTELLIGALLFSMFIGMAAGAIPAYRASKLKPVDALRY